jgi:hypothetical protein
MRFTAKILKMPCPTSRKKLLRNYFSGLVGCTVQAETLRTLLNKGSPIVKFYTPKHTMKKHPVVNFAIIYRQLNNSAAVNDN